MVTVKTFATGDIILCMYTAVSRSSLARPRTSPNQVERTRFPKYQYSMFISSMQSTNSEHGAETGPSLLHHTVHSNMHATHTFTRHVILADRMKQHSVAVRACE